MTLSAPETLAGISAWQAQQRGDATAFVFEGCRSTFSQFDRHANQVAAGLVAEGIMPQARVAVLAKDSIDSYQILFGCAKARAVLIGINWRLSAAESVYILQNGEVEIVFVAKDFLERVAAAKHALPRLRTIVVLDAELGEYPSFQGWRDRFPPTPPALQPRPEDVVVQMYTSGTTGHPKGVQLQNDAFFRLMRGMRERGDLWMDLNPEDRLLISLPQFHMGGIWWAIQGFIAGAQGIVIDTFVAWKVLELIERHRISKVPMVPAMIQTTLAEPTCDSTDLSSVKGFLYGGSPIAPALLKKAMARFGCGFFQIYGMTETGNMAVCLRPEDHEPANPKRLESAGRALPGVELRVIDAEGRCLPPLAIGEICIKSPANMVGYWNNPAATRECLSADGWVRTGDAGYLDDQGYLFICDRLKDMIIYGGENIYPAEIEAALCEHDGVAEAAVIGVPDERWGEVVKAFVVLRPGWTIKPRELINFTRQRIADFKAPKSIDFLEKLPRNPSGKILKRELRTPYWTAQSRQVN
ncbi:long-chain-fatty-acid--CoA ligase [Methylomonas sp. EFPC3]|uniref:long-chain-fatty-acid--CoA ligase n=1 Tax=Methylomonas sp. EFPC3 TaxID=3021710 RepID=UPI002415D329|nr:long-chain-fatty-acid--CoA ligase [Methylomonas sp. EFPC3]WFP48563.1 long-chain-fatty-acid--CoA ligase [Methylomonas sp. EFPC3]